MSKYVMLNDDILTDIAGAIRSVNGTSDTYKPGEMAEQISNASKIVKYTGDYFEVTPPSGAIVADGATKVRAGCFYGNGTITSVSIANATAIESGAFYFCSSMTSIYAPNVTFIGGAAFGYCYGLTTLNFPKLEVVEYNAFILCDYLKSVYLEGDKVVEGASYLLDGGRLVSGGTILYVPANLLDQYHAAYPDDANQILAS